MDCYWKLRSRSRCVAACGSSTQLQVWICGQGSRRRRYTSEFTSMQQGPAIECGVVADFGGSWRVKTAILILRLPTQQCKEVQCWDSSRSLEAVALGSLLCCCSVCTKETVFWCSMWPKRRTCALPYLSVVVIFNKAYVQIFIARWHGVWLPVPQWFWKNMV